ncbi:MAG: CapA family protein [Cyanobacteria bacterium P01_D01_bin.56]
MSNAPVDINQIKAIAATGHFRSLALWLNYPLVPQAIYAQVQPHSESGYLRVLLEFERSPKQEALVRLVCHRICLLDTDIIRGLYLVGRHIGTEKPLWQQRVRLSRRVATSSKSHRHKPHLETPAKVLSTQKVAASNQPRHISAVEALPETPPVPTASITTVTYGSDVLNAVPSSLIPRDSHHSERRRRPNRNVTPAPFVHIRPADINRPSRANQRRQSYQRRHLGLLPREILEQQFKYVRAMVVTGSAAAAFILGCVTEAVVSHRGQIAEKQAPALPTLNEGWRTLSDVEAQEIAYRSSMRGPSVPAALESVAVIPHEPHTNPEDPTVTLVFGGDVAVGDVPLQTPDAVSQVLGDLAAFREADVAMVGLGNTLASADTSLQETYLERTRADAVDAMQQGGIDIVSLTGDRTMDFGRQGLTETLDSLDGAGIYRVGAGRNSQEARRPEILDVKGQRIAYLSYAPEGKTAANPNKAGLNIQTRTGIIEDISALRQAVDWIVVNYRWQGELAIAPHEQQVDLSRSAIDAGADLVVGYHPQQIQGAELYKSRPIVYALGDFIFQDAPLEDRDTATLRVSLRDQQMKVEFLPISILEATPKEASGEKAKAILQKIRKASEQLQTPLRFPTILEATPHKTPLLKPEKPTAPLKTFGELEPPTSDDFSYESSDYWRDDGTAAPDFTGAESFDSHNYIPNSLETPTLQTTEFENHTLDVEHNTNFAVPLSDESPDTWKPTYGVPSSETPTIEGPLDTFKVQPDHATDSAIEADAVETYTPPQQTPVLPKETLDSNDVPDEAPLKPELTESEMLKEAENNGQPSEHFIDIDTLEEEAPEDTDEIVSPEEQPLPGYDSLNNWGEKQSPHEEFNPIEERLNSLKLSEDFDSDSSDTPEMSEEEYIPTENQSKENSIELKELPTQDTSGAISPHDEPLIGPLS